MIQQIFKLVIIILTGAEAASKNKQHSHNGILEPYEAKPVPFTLTGDQCRDLELGKSVVKQDIKGLGGKGIVIQDIDACPSICMSLITDVGKYPGRVPRIQKVEIYDRKIFKNGTICTGAKFNLRFAGLSFGSFFKLIEEPKYKTFRWTLDYKYSSDFNDNVGLWVVTQHPKKQGWSRVSYSTKMSVFPWIPKLVINLIVKSALTDSTRWIVREAELEAKSRRIAVASEKKSINPLTSKLFKDFQFPASIIGRQITSNESFYTYLEVRRNQAVDTFKNVFKHFIRM